MESTSHTNSIHLSSLRALSERISSAVDKYERSKDNELDAELASVEISKAAEELRLETQDPLRRLFLITHHGTQIAILRAAVEAHVFDHFPREGDITLEDLSQSSNVDIALLVRILRVLTAMSFVEETGVHRYTLSRHGKYLAIKKYQSMVWLGFDLHFHTDDKLPEFLATTKYKNPTDSTYAPFHFVYPDKKTIFEYLGEHPELLHHFHTSMAAGADYNVYNMVDEAPWPAILGKVANNEVAIIDLGGADGSVLTQILNKYPDLMGEFILQDLPDVLEAVGPNLDKRIKPMPHNFFTEQPVKGARAYHFRMIFHDWPHEDCVKILRNLKPAMKPGYSKILITDLVVPDMGASPLHTTLDICMMKLGGQEKSESTFRELLESEGFVLKKVWRSARGIDGMIEAELPS